MCEVRHLVSPGRASRWRRYPAIDVTHPGAIREEKTIEFIDTKRETAKRAYLTPAVTRIGSSLGGFALFVRNHDKREKTVIFGARPHIRRVGTLASWTTSTILPAPLKRCTCFD